MIGDNILAAANARREEQLRELREQRAREARFVALSHRQLLRDTAEAMTDDQLRRHAEVSARNNHQCNDCFCCTARLVLTERIAARRAHEAA